MDRQRQNPSPQNKPPRISILHVRSNENLGTTQEMQIPTSPLQPQNFTLIQPNKKEYQKQKRLAGRNRSNSHSPEKFKSGMMGNIHNVSEMLSSIPDSTDFKRWKDNESPTCHSIYEQ